MNLTPVVLAMPREIAEDLTELLSYDITIPEALRDLGMPEDRVIEIEQSMDYLFKALASVL